MDLLQHTGDQAAVESVGFSGRINTEEGQDGFGIRLPAKGKIWKNNQRIGSVHWRFEEKKRPDFAEEEVVIYQDHGKVHPCVVPMAKLNEFGPHPPNSPDLAPNDNFLIPNLMIWRGEKKFGCNNEFIIIVNPFKKYLQTLHLWNFEKLTCTFCSDFLAIFDNLLNFYIIR